MAARSKKRATKTKGSFIGWKTLQESIPAIKKSILIEGLPGIGNVGKIAVDFLIEELKAKKLCSFFSSAMPATALVNNESILSLPKIELYYKRRARNTLLFLSGDVQPINEAGIFSFCEELLRLLESYGCKQIICLGGIGLQAPPEKPKVCYAGNSEKALKHFQRYVKHRARGIVGTIVGVSGVLPALAAEKDIDAIVLLAEAHAHPLHVGIAGARKLVSVLSKVLGLEVDESKIEREAKEFEREMAQRVLEFKKALERKSRKETSYIG